MHVLVRSNVEGSASARHVSSTKRDRNERHWSARRFRVRSARRCPNRPDGSSSLPLRSYNAKIPLLVRRRRNEGQPSKGAATRVQANAESSAIRPCASLSGRVGRRRSRLEKPLSVAGLEECLMMTDSVERTRQPPEPARQSLSMHIAGPDPSHATIAGPTRSKLCEARTRPEVERSDLFADGSLTKTRLLHAARASAREDHKQGQRAITRRAFFRTRQWRTLPRVRPRRAATSRPVSPPAASTPQPVRNRRGRARGIVDVPDADRVTRPIGRDAPRMASCKVS